MSEVHFLHPFLRQDFIREMGWKWSKTKEQPSRIMQTNTQLLLSFPTYVTRFLFYSSVPFVVLFMEREK